LIVFVDLHEIGHFFGKFDDFFDGGRKFGGKLGPYLFRVFNAQREFVFSFVIVRLSERKKINILSFLGSKYILTLIQGSDPFDLFTVITQK